MKNNKFTFSSKQLFTYDKCTHPVISNEMCGVCGADLKTQWALSFVMNLVLISLIW